jgi:hypothetical protein
VVPLWKTLLEPPQPPASPPRLEEGDLVRHLDPAGVNKATRSPAPEVIVWASFQYGTNAWSDG